MPGDWFKTRVDLPDDPKILRLSQELKRCIDTILGMMIRLWSFAARHSADGYLRGMNRATLDAYVGCDGFAAALMLVGWLAEDAEGSLRVPEFEKYNSSAKLRAADRERKARQRAAMSDGQGRDKGGTSSGRWKEENRMGAGPSLSRSDSLSSSSGGGCRGEEARTSAPPDLELTPERELVATEAGVSSEFVQREWRRFTLHDFNRSITDWDRAWAKWVANHDPRKVAGAAGGRGSLVDQNEAALEAVFGPNTTRGGGGGGDGK